MTQPATRALRGLGGLKGPLGVYVHWPYCAAKCPYCAFNKYTVPTTSQDRRLEAALVREATTSLSHGPEKRRVRSIYFGGGTPSLMPTGTAGRVIDQVCTSADVDPAAEITIECNPNSVTEEKLREWKASRVTRISMGVQSFHPKILKALGRDHTSKEARKAIALASKYFPGHVTMDLIFGSHGQSIEEWRDDLETAISLGTDHMSIYQLTLERGTPLFRTHQKGTSVLVPIPVIEDMYTLAEETCREAGLTHYEVSSYARAPEKRGVHNSGYWRGMDYIGIGPGAHGRYTTPQGKRIRTYRILEPVRWMAAVEEEGEGLARSTPMDPTDIAHELIALGLRSTFGISPSTFTSITSMPLSSWLDEEELAACVEGGLLSWDGRPFHPTSILSPTPRGMAVLDALVPRIISA